MEKFMVTDLPSINGKGLKLTFLIPFSIRNYVENNLTLRCKNDFSPQSRIP